MPNPPHENHVAFSPSPGTCRTRPDTRTFALLAAALVAAGASFTVPLARSHSNAVTSSSHDHAATLHPFVVIVDKDLGVVAASSLAGGRLSGNLRDTPVACSVLTWDFIEARQLADHTEITRWFNNAVDLSDSNSSNDTRTNVRLSALGLSGELQRDFLPLSLNFDSYNVDRLDLARGAPVFIKDLKQRGLLDDRLTLRTTEFGRMPSSQGGNGRDHNPFSFTNWLCGGGIKGYTTHGESDLWGYKPLNQSNPTTVYDIHATILHELGLDHTRLTFRCNGMDRRLTDVHSHVSENILA